MTPLSYLQTLYEAREQVLNMIKQSGNKNPDYSKAYIEQLNKLNTDIRRETNTVQEYPVFMACRGDAPWIFTHWVLKTQNYYFELFVGENNRTTFSCKEATPQRRVAANILVGSTFLVQAEIKIIGQEIIDTKFEHYDFLQNNCQHFVNNLINEITNGGKSSAVYQQEGTFSRFGKNVSAIHKRYGVL